MIVQFWVFTFWIAKIVSDNDFSKSALPWWKFEVSSFSLKARRIEIIFFSRVMGARIRRGVK